MMKLIRCTGWRVSQKVKIQSYRSTSMLPSELAKRTASIMVPALPSLHLSPNRKLLRFGFAFRRLTDRCYLCSSSGITELSWEDNRLFFFSFYYFFSFLIYDLINEFNQHTPCVIPIILYCTRGYFLLYTGVCIETENLPTDH